MPTQCGRPVSGPRPEPPLKSMKSRLTRSGGWLAARPAARVRRNSDFPEPVVPATRKCGPSAFRSIRRVPGTAAPTGAPSPASAPDSGPAPGDVRRREGEEVGQAAVLRGWPAGEPPHVPCGTEAPAKAVKDHAGPDPGRSQGGTQARALRRPRTSRGVPGRAPASTRSPSTRAPWPGPDRRLQPSTGRPRLLTAAERPKNEDSAVDFVDRPDPPDSRRSRSAARMPAARVSRVSNGLMRGESCGGQEARGKERRCPPGHAAAAGSAGQRDRRPAAG